MKIEKLEKVIDSCTSNKQLIIALVYAELFLEKYSKYYDLNSKEEKQYLKHIGRVLSNKSKDVCCETQAINFKIYLNATNEKYKKTIYSKRYFRIVESYRHIPVTDRIKREEYL